MISRIRFASRYRTVIRLVHTGSDSDANKHGNAKKINTEHRHPIISHIAKTISVVPPNFLPSSNKDKNSETTTSDLDSSQEWIEDDFLGRDFQKLGIDDYQEIFKEKDEENSLSIQEKINQILTEYEYEKYSSNGRMPVTIAIKEMEELLLLDPFNTSQILKYLRFLFNKEMARKRSKRLNKLKREASKQETALRLAAQNRVLKKTRTGIIDPEDGELLYGLWHNSLFVRVSTNVMRNSSSTPRVRQAAMFNQKLVIDFSYDQYMSRQEMKNIADQLRLVYGLNRFDYKEPFDLHFCNFDPEKSFTASEVTGRINNLFTGSMITITNKNYTELFPKERIIYLSPHAKLPLKDYTEDDVFVLGAMNDKSGPKTEISNVLAHQNGVRCYKLPIDQHVSWLQGTKSLCLNHVTGILLEHRECKDWRSSFEKHIPKRKLKPIEQVLEEDRYRRQKLNSNRKIFKSSPRNQ